MNIEDTEDWIDETDDSPETLEAEGDGQLFEHWRMEVDAGQKPGVILRLKTKNRVIEQAREFISAWADVRPENQPEKEKQL